MTPVSPSPWRRWNVTKRVVGDGAERAICSTDERHPGVHERPLHRLHIVVPCAHPQPDEPTLIVPGGRNRDRRDVEHAGRRGVDAPCALKAIHLLERLHGRDRGRAIDPVDATTHVSALGHQRLLHEAYRLATRSEAEPHDRVGLGLGDCRRDDVADRVPRHHRQCHSKRHDESLLAQAPRPIRRGLPRIITRLGHE